MKISRLGNFLLIFTLFFCSCTTKKTFKIAEKNKVASFLNQFLFVEGAVFSVFGDKPLSAMLVYVGSEDALDQLTEEELKRAVYVDDSIYKGWKAWKKVARQLSFKNFQFSERPCIFDPDHILYFVMNVKRVKALLKKYQIEFQTKTGMQFKVENVIREFKDPKSIFWNKVFSDHYLAGLLFGYGEENIAYFSERLKNQDMLIHFSDEYDLSATSSKFSIPIFAVSSEERVTGFYREQREMIQKEYCDKDLIEVTLRRLLGD